MNLLGEATNKVGCLHGAEALILFLFVSLGSGCIVNLVLKVFGKIFGK